MSTRRQARVIDLDDINIAARGGSLGDAELGRIWDALCAEGAAGALFFDGCVTDFEGFQAFAGEEGREFFAVRAGGGPAAVFWLDGRSGRAARIHFAVLRRAHGRAARVIGNYVVDWLLTRRGPGGGRILDVLVGVTPATHALAVKYVRDIGFTVLGTVPHALALPGGGATGAVVSYIAKKED